MKIFAVINNDIMRLKLDQSAQALAEGVFSSAKQRFTFSEEIPFSADYTPSKNECFIISNFQSSINFNLLRTDIEAITEFGSDGNIQLNDISSIFALDNDGNILIQYFDKRNVIDLSRTFLSSFTMQSHQFVAATTNGISLSNDLIAIVSPNNDIKFRSLQLLRHIFDMDRYFKEATDTEVNSFLNKSVCFEIEPNFNIERVDDSTVRKKVTIINNSQVLENYTVSELIEAAESVNYPIPTNASKDKLLIPVEKRPFKDLLQFLSANIYKDPITGETRITNSSRPYR